MITRIPKSETFSDYRVLMRIGQAIHFTALFNYFCPYKDISPSYADKAAASWAIPHCMSPLTNADVGIAMSGLYRVLANSAMRRFRIALGLPFLPTLSASFARLPVRCPARIRNHSSVRWSHGISIPCAAITLRSAWSPSYSMAFCRWCRSACTTQKSLHGPYALSV